MPVRKRLLAISVFPPCAKLSEPVLTTSMFVHLSASKPFSFNSAGPSRHSCITAMSSSDPLWPGCSRRGASRAGP